MPIYRHVLITPTALQDLKIYINPVCVLKITVNFLKIPNICFVIEIGIFFLTNINYQYLNKKKCDPVINQI